MTTQVAAPAAEVVPDPIQTLATAFTAITTALEAHKAQDGAVETAKEAETRANQALTVAKERTVSAKTVAASGVSGVMASLDGADTALASVREMFTA